MLLLLQLFSAICSAAYLSSEISPVNGTSGARSLAACTAMLTTSSTACTLSDNTAYSVPATGTTVVTLKITGGQGCSAGTTGATQANVIAALGGAGASFTVSFFLGGTAGTDFNVLNGAAGEVSSLGGGGATGVYQLSTNRVIAVAAGGGGACHAYISCSGQTCAGKCNGGDAGQPGGSGSGGSPGAYTPPSNSPGGGASQTAVGSQPSGAGAATGYAGTASIGGNGGNGGYATGTRSAGWGQGGAGGTAATIGTLNYFGGGGGGGYFG
jgi:hypothetical protein